MPEKEIVPLPNMEDVDTFEEVHDYLNKAEELGQQAGALLKLLELYERKYGFDEKLSSGLDAELLKQPYHRFDKFYKESLKEGRRAFRNALYLDSLTNNFSDFERNKKEKSNKASFPEIEIQKENFHFHIQENERHKNSIEKIKGIATNIHKLFGSSIETFILLRGSDGQFAGEYNAGQSKENTFPEQIKNNGFARPGEGLMMIGDIFLSGKFSRYLSSIVEHETIHQMDDFFKISETEEFKDVFKKHGDKGYMHFLREENIFKNSTEGHPEDDEKEFFASFVHCLQHPNILERFLPKDNVEKGMLFLFVDTVKALLASLERVKKEQNIKEMPIEKQLQNVLNYINSNFHYS